MASAPASLRVLPTRTAGAAENMALDFLLLTRCPGPPAPQFRHYEWRAPAFTFGFSQKLAWVRENLPSFAGASAGDTPGERIDLCRRPTGGGIVDHRNDWTYALVVPRTHPWYDERASEFYRTVHLGLAAALVELGQPAELKEGGPGSGARGEDTGGEAPGQEEGAGGPSGVCFQKAERFDVVNARTGAKIAGAAQKRNKHGMLFQGSIEKSAIAPIDWEDFRDDFVAELARAMGVSAEESPWPDLAESEVEGLIEQYSSPEWLEYR